MRHFISERPGQHLAGNNGNQQEGRLLQLREFGNQLQEHLRHSAHHKYAEDSAQEEYPHLTAQSEGCNYTVNTEGYIH
ncbi:hypothetical protein D3C73_1016290 [compost metagenome]